MIDYFHCLKEIFELRKNQYLKRDGLLKIQERNLRIISDHAFHNVRSYNSKFKLKGIRPNEIKKIEDLTKIPLMTKQEIKDGMEENPRYVLDTKINLNKCRVTFTSGTTGMLLKIYKSKKDIYHNWARQVFAFFECGLKLNDKIIRLLLPKTKEKYWFQKFGVLCIEDISIKQPIDDIINKLSKSKFDAIQSYPTIYLLLAQYIRNSEIDPRIIFSAAERLSGKSRRIINSIFNTELFELYGAYEFGRIAFECKQHCGMHIISDHYIIEILREGEQVSPGEEGEIFITGLHNYTMPLIRYRIGDIGILSDEFCSCGRKHPLIKSIEGRTDDFLTLSSGRIISPRNINTLEFIKGISEFQIIQERKDKFLVNIVKCRGFSKNTIFDIKETVKSGCLGEEVYVEVKVVDRIKRDKSKKNKNVISKV